MHVFEIAQALGRPDREVITVLNRMGVPATSYASVVDISAVLQVCRFYIQTEDIQPRTILYLDEYNIYKIAKQYYGRRPDFRRLLEIMTGSPLPWMAKAFMPSNGNGTGLERALRRIGYLVFTKAGRAVSPERRKANFDVEIAVETTEDFQRYRPEAVYLVSGDGDFVSLVKRLRSKGCRVTVAAFPKGFSQELKSAADRAVELGTDVLQDQRSREWDPVRGRVRLSIWLSRALAWNPS